MLTLQLVRLSPEYTTTTEINDYQVYTTSTTTHDINKHHEYTTSTTTHDINTIMNKQQENSIQASFHVQPVRTILYSFIHHSHDSHCSQLENDSFQNKTH